MTDIEPPTLLATLEAELAQLRLQLRQTILERDTLKGQGNLREEFWQDARNQISKAIEERDITIQKSQHLRRALVEIQVGVLNPEITLDKIKTIADTALDDVPSNMQVDKGMGRKPE